MYLEQATMGTKSSKTTKKDVQLQAEHPEEIYCAAWAIVLARHGGDGEAGEVEVSFGCATNTSQEAMRTLHLEISTGAEIGTFLEVVRQKLETLSSAELASKRSLGCLLPFSSTLTIGNTAAREDGCLHSTIDITCAADLHSPAIKAHQQANTTRSAHVALLLAQFETAILQIRTLPPSSRVQDINILSKADTQQLLHWNRESPPCVDETLCGLFARHVRSQPCAPAVCSWDGDLTYAELDSKSENLAEELVRRGVAPHAVVALCFDKSAIAVVVMMAVLRTGASFANLGISTPIQRQAAILRACQAVLLIVDTSNSTRLVDHQPISGLIVDDRFVADLPQLSIPLPTVEPHHAAAITFTSGSTGTPKGIVVEHGSIATSCKAMADRLDIGPHTRILQFASYTFDASVGDIFYALSRGACVCSPSEQERVNNLAAAARRLQVNWAFLTPSVLSLVEPEDIPSLRRLLVGGEPPSPKHVNLWARSVSLHLVMGPAECAIYCAASEAIRPGQDPSTFGRAAGCRMWVVDSQDHTKLAPIGCPGELIVEGRTVARGYLNDPERTRQVFIDDAPWLPRSANTTSSRRLYKSGDLVRFHVEDGTFSFVARKDTQVKLHGQRVELGEIEHHLKNALPEVDSALAFLNTSAASTNRHPLIAYLVFSKDSVAISHAQDTTLIFTEKGTNMLLEARSKLAAVLPAYMLPTLFIPLQRVPFTLNGKRDIARLREIAHALSEDQLQAFSLSKVEVIRPLTSQEERLRELWAQVLRIDAFHLGPDSDFIRQGGDSLAAMRLGSLALEAGLDLPVSYTMTHPRLSDMAAKMGLWSPDMRAPTPEPFTLLPSAVNSTDIRALSAKTCEILEDQIEDVYPATPLQEMLWSGSSRRPGTYILRLTFQLPPSVLLQTFMTAWDEVVASAEILRTRLITHEQAGLLQVVVKDFPWEIYDQFHEYKHQNSHEPMSYGDRLAYLTIIRNTPTGTPTFIFTAHHVLYDAFAINMLFDRVAQAYQTGASSPLFPFKTYVHYLQRIPLPPSLSFWTQNLANATPPTWPPPSPPDAKTTLTVRRRILLSTRPTRFTLAIYAQAAFTLIYSTHVQTSDVLFGMTFSGRDAALPAILSTAGPTLYSVPFRTRIEPAQELGKFLDTIRQDILATALHGHIGLPKIRTASEDAEKACGFRCIFAVQPRRVEADESVFGERVSMMEEMGRLDLIVECFVEEGGVELVVEYNMASLGKEEVQSMIEGVGELLPRLVGLPFATVIKNVLVGEEGREGAVA